ncbi:MAG: response regulator [Desulfobacteraceae bacterium]|nr:MAG: response regulator [Desulfobacteraceae bacterium]
MPHRILTVDDSRTIRMIVKNAFKEYECELYEAENGRDGLALASEIKPDLVILDITMPVMTGIEMLGKMMENADLKSTAVIMLTAESGRDNVMNIVKMGVKDYIVKPFKGEQLIERVKLILNDLKPRIDLSTNNGQRANGTLFSVKGDIVILTLPPKMTRNIASDIEEQVKAKIGHMNEAGVRKFILNLSSVDHLSMTTMQSVLALLALCVRAKLLIRLAATGIQAEALKSFKETNAIPTKLSIEEAITDFFPRAC